MQEHGNCHVERVLSPMESNILGTQWSGIFFASETNLVRYIHKILATVHDTGHKKETDEAPSYVPCLVCCYSFFVQRVPIGPNFHFIVVSICSTIGLLKQGFSYGDLYGYLKRKFIYFVTAIILRFLLLYSEV